MIEIYIDPTMFTIGPFAITWHGFFSAVGLFFGVWLTAKLAPQVGISEDQIWNAAPFAVIGGIIGARLFHVIDRWDYYSTNPVQIVMLTEGGIAIYGAVVGGVLAGYVYARYVGMNIAGFADAAGIGLMLGQGIGRIGDVINGEHLGKALSAPFAVIYTHPLTLGEIGQPVHLAVGYELILDMIAFVVLLRLWRKLPPGVLFWLYVTLYSVIRLFVGFYRKDTLVAFGMGQAQLLGVLGILIGVPMMFLVYQRAKKRGWPNTPAPSDGDMTDSGTQSGESTEAVGRMAPDADETSPNPTGAA